MTDDTSDDLKLGVQVTSGIPGVTPAAFLAVVEVIDAEGEKRYEIVESNGLSDKRRLNLHAALADFAQRCDVCGITAAETPSYGWYVNDEGRWCADHRPDRTDD